MWFVIFDFELLFNKDFTPCWNTVDYKLLKVVMFIQLVKEWFLIFRLDNFTTILKESIVP